MRIVRGIFGKIVVLTQSAIDFIGGYVNEAEVICRISKTTPIFGGYLKQCDGADDVTSDKLHWSIDRTIHVGFSSQVHDCIWFELRKGGLHCNRVTNVRLDKMIVRVLSYVVQRSKVSSISQLVDIEDFITTGNQKFYKVGTDKSGSASNKNIHEFNNL